MRWEGDSVACHSCHPTSSGLLHTKILDDADDEPIGRRLALAWRHLLDDIARRQEELFAAIDQRCGGADRLVVLAEDRFGDGRFDFADDLRGRFRRLDDGLLKIKQLVQFVRRATLTFVDQRLRAGKQRDEIAATPKEIGTLCGSRSSSKSTG